MKLKDDADRTAFLKEVEACRDDVFFKTPDGGSLDLKSVLAQYVFVVAGDGNKLTGSGSIVCSDEDAEKLSAYLETE